MFDIGFSELLLLAIVGLLVLGPQRLPKAARMLGLWLRKAKASWYSVKAELERELADEELKRSLKSTRDDLERAGRELDTLARRDVLKPVNEAMDRSRRQLSAAAAEARALSKPDEKPEPGPKDRDATEGDGDRSPRDRT